MTYGVHWFRRDLRVAGNPALTANWKKNEGRVVGLFCFDKKFLARPDFSVNRFQFFLETLFKLREELREQGSDLLVLDVGPAESFPSLLKKLKAPPSLFTWNRDYEPFARDRDAKMEKWLTEQGIAFQTERDHVVIEPHEIYKGNDPSAAYQIYTPYSKRWLERFKDADIQAFIAEQKKPAKQFGLTWKKLGIEIGHVLEQYRDENAKRVTIPIPPAGVAAALAHLKKFRPKMKDYPTARDIPSVPGTSQVSIYLKNGSLTVARIIAELELTSGKYLLELVWREFYYYILARFPNVEHSAFLKRYENIPWQNRKDWFEAWKAGKTGYPIVDAGMRQLNTTGWMHNRVRMIVASFLTKDLLIDWKWGERYFMEQLLDGDLAPNNGGWQWAASTGCDAQPYFRIFNPTLQSKRFDPDGEYIKTYCPELKHLSKKEIHEARPNAICDHSTQRDLALALYKEARAT